MRQFPLFLVLASLLAILMGGCSSDGPKRVRGNPFENEKRTDRKIAKLTVEELYASAREALQAGDPQRALELYREVESRHPFTRYATQAQLDSIFAHYRAQQHDLALTAANRFIKQHPQHARIDYVYYLRGLVNFSRSEGEFDRLLRVDGTTRDPVYARSAFEDFSLLVKRFPDSRYSQDARRRMIHLREGLGRHELAIADFYLRRRAWVASSRRAQYIVEHYQGTGAIAPALDILVQSYTELGLEKPAADAQATLAANFPDYESGDYRRKAGWSRWVDGFEDPVAKIFD